MHPNKDGRRAKSTSTLSWVSDKLAAGAARVNGGEFQDIEVAVLKATNHDVVPPKEKHVRTLREVIGTSLNKKRVVYIIHALYERLRTPHETWLVILKTLMVFHKLMKADGEASFKQEMVKYKQKRKLSRLLSLENFTDRTKSESWDFSAFVRVYSLYLEEKLVVFEEIQFDVERDSRSDGLRFKSASSHEILIELPKLQKLLQRILACIPEGNAMRNDVVLESMKWTMTECFKLYRTISEGVISLSEQFFQMDKIDARKGLEMYKEAMNSTLQIQSFFSAMQNLTIGQQIQFPQLETLPEDFVEQMEEYVKGATSRTITRRFPSILSRNARGGPSPAISGGGSEILRKQSKTSEEVEEGIQSDFLNLDINDSVISPRENNSPVTPQNPVPPPFADPVLGIQNPANTGPVFGARDPVLEDPVFTTQNPANTGPVFGARDPVLEDPVFTTQNPANTGPVFGARDPVLEDPVFTTQNPANTGPVFGSKDPVLEDPVLRIQNPANTGPVFGAKDPVLEDPVFTTQNPANTEPVFGARDPVLEDPVFTAQNSANTGPVFGERSILDEWTQPSGVLSSFPDRTVSYHDRSMTQFDDFFGGGVMPHPPPSHSSGNLQSGNPFDDAGLNSLPQQDSLQTPSPQKIQHQYSARRFTGRGSLTDPFHGLNPSIQQKTSLANPGVPMRSENRDFANTSTPQSTSNQQDYPSFFF